MTSFLKEPPPLRSEAYRRLVSSLPCIACGIEGRSQAAHANTGKAKGRKVDDRDTFPLCGTMVWSVGCHVEHDMRMHGLSKDEYEKLEQYYITRTQDKLRKMARDDRIVAKILESVGLLEEKAA